MRIKKMMQMNCHDSFHDHTIKVHDWKDINTDNSTQFAIASELMNKKNPWWEGTDYYTMYE